MQDFIKIEDLSFTYDLKSNLVLEDIHLTIAAGEYIALIGPNGSGKTSLIRHLNALLLPSKGKVIINGLDTKNTKSQMEIRRQVGMIFQNPDSQIVGLSVEEDVAFGPGNLGIPAGEIRKRVDASLKTAGLTGLEKQSPYKLSGGQKQQLALAGLLAMDPKIIVLDEPTSALDPDGKKKVLDLLNDLHQKGIGIIHVTQSMDEAALADRILVMDQGKIISDGLPEEILSQVDWLKGLGLTPPPITELMLRLEDAGLNLTKKLFTIEEACDELKMHLRNALKLSDAPPGRNKY